MLYNIGAKTEDCLYNKIDGEELLTKLETYFKKSDKALKAKIKLYIKNPVNFYKLSSHLNINEKELLVLLHVIFPDIFSKRMITALSRIYLKPEYDKTAIMQQIEKENIVKENKKIILKLELLKSKCKKAAAKLKKIKNKNYRFKTKKERQELLLLAAACANVLKVFKTINNKSMQDASLTYIINTLKAYNKNNKT